MMNANKKFATVRSGGIVFKIVIALAVALACFMLIDLTSQEPKLAHLTNTIAGQTKVRNDGSGNVERPQQKPPVQVDTQAGAAAAAEDQQLQPEEPAEINGHAEPEGPEESGEQLDVEKPAPTDKPKLPLHPTMVPRQTPWLETSVHRSICTNTCPTAHDGVCDDGRQQQTNPEIDYSTVTCDLGTDCGDCGPFEFSGPKFALDWAPIAETRAKGITVRVKRAVFDDLERPSFLFAYTDPAQDVDVSAVS